MHLVVLGENETGKGAVVYALGCVLYEMLGGAPPFTGSTALTALDRKLHDPVPSLRAVRDTVPEALEQRVLKALAREREDRFANAAELVGALERLAG